VGSTQTGFAAEDNDQDHAENKNGRCSDGSASPITINRRHQKAGTKHA
jgi:hypothetical protein